MENQQDESVDIVFLHNPLLLGIVSKIISKAIKKKYGASVDLKIEKLDIINRDMRRVLDFTLRASGSIPKDDLSKFV